MMGGKGKMGSLMKAMGGMQGGMPMPPQGADAMPDMNEMMNSGNMPDLSSMLGAGGGMPDLSELAGGLGKKNKAPQGAGSFLSGLFRRRR